MSVFNNFGEFNAEEEAARRAENLRILEESSTPNMQNLPDMQNMPIRKVRKIFIPEESKAINSVLQINFAKVEIKAIAQAIKERIVPTAKIENNGGFYSADCLHCGKTKILSSELNSLSAVCNKCHCVFRLEE